MLGKNTLVAFVATADGERARRFYRDVLGLRVVSDDPYALVCDVNGAPLRIQKVTSFRPRDSPSSGGRSRTSTRRWTRSPLVVSHSSATRG